MKDSWVTVGAFPTAVEAELAKNRLAQEGIDAVLSDAEAVSMIFAFSGAIGGVKLLVSEENAGRAEAILERVKRGGRGRRDDYGLEENVTDVPEKVRVPVDDEAPADDDEDEEEARDSQKDIVARQAWRAAVFGLVLCPGVFHIFSAFTVLEIAKAEGELTPAGRRCVLGALVIDALVLILMIAVVISTLTHR